MQIFAALPPTLDDLIAYGDTVVPREHQEVLLLIAVQVHRHRTTGLRHRFDDRVSPAGDTAVDANSLPLSWCGGQPSIAR